MRGKYLYEIGEIINGQKILNKITIKKKSRDKYYDIKGYTVECISCGFISDKIQSNITSYKCGNCVKNKKLTIEDINKRINIINPKLKIISKEYINNSTNLVFKCDRDHIFESTWGNINNGTSCPICLNKKLSTGFNDVATTHPHLVEFFKNIEDSKTTTYSSSKKFNFKCPDCGNIKRYKMNTLYGKGFRCERCGDGISICNKYMYSVLENLNVEFDCEFAPDWCLFYNIYNGNCSKGKYDFVIEDYKIIIEVDGDFHRIDNKMNGQTVEESVYRDNMKDDLARNNGYNVIRISTEDSFKENILNSKLIKYFDFSKINWNECEIFSYKSKIKMAAELFDKYDDTDIISKILKISVGTCRRYLNIARNFNMCNYKGVNNNRHSRRKNIPVKWIDKDMCFENAYKVVEYFKEIENIEMNIKYVKATCEKYQNTYMGYKFEYC